LADTYHDSLLKLIFLVAPLKKLPGNHFGTPTIFNGDEAILLGADPAKNAAILAIHHSQRGSRHVRSIAGNDQYVSATSMNGNAEQAQFDAKAMLEHTR
jgi:hypothetical protein